MDKTVALRALERLTREPRVYGVKIQSSPSIFIFWKKEGVSEGVGRQFNPDHRLKFLLRKNLF